MKVTIFSLHLGFGGAEKYVSTIANILSEQYDVEIISTYRITDEPAFHINENISVSYLMKEKPNAQEFKSAVKSGNLVKIFLAAIYAIRVLVKKYVLNLKAVKECDADVIISTRSFHNTMINKFSNPKCIKIATEHNHPCGSKRYVKKLEKSITTFDYLLPISKELTQFYQKNDRISATVKYLPFCIDEHTCSTNLSFGEPVFVSVGRLSPEKGYLDLIEIFDHLIKRYPKAKLHIVGSGQEKESLESAIEKKGLQHSIIMHGFLNKSDVYKVLDMSTIYLMTSFTESFGIVLLEAMSSGLPCVAFDSAQGAHEIIKDGKNGYLIPERSISLFVDAVGDLIDNPNNLNQMHENALDTAKQYTYHKTQQAWLAFFDEIKERGIR